MELKMLEEMVRKSARNTPTGKAVLLPNDELPSALRDAATKASHKVGKQLANAEAGWM